MRLGLAVVGVLCASPVMGQNIYRVLQQGASAGIWAELGRIEGVPTTLSAEAYYDFTGGNPDLPPGAPPLVSDASHAWILESDVDGICFLFIHDRQGDGSGGRAETQTRVTGDSDGMGWLVQDGIPPNDDYTGTDGDSVFTAVHNWPDENSDGAVLGPLDNCWSIQMSFTDLAGGSGNEHDGLTAWRIASGDGSTLFPVLFIDRPVRILSIFNPDWNGDGLSNTADFVAYLNDFNAAMNGQSTVYGDPDIGVPLGVLNTADFLRFLNIYSDGCG